MQLAIAVASSLACTILLLWLIGVCKNRLRIVRQLAFPLYVAALAAGLRIFLIFEAGTFTALETTLSWLLVFLISIALLRVIGLYVFEVYLYVHRGLRLPPLLPAVAMGCAYLLTALVILPLAIPSLEVGPILASGAVTSLVLGLALQPILGNFFAGVVITLEKPFRINDWIKLGDVEGRVVAITWRTTHLRTRDNDNLVIPNGRIADQEVLNYFYPHPLHLERVYVGVHYRTPPYRVKQALLDVAERVDTVLDKPSPAVFLVSFDDSAITYELRVWIEDIAHKPRIASHLRSEIWEEFRRRSITIPFPIRTLEFEPRARQVEMVEPSASPPTAGTISPRASLYIARGPGHGANVDLAEESVLVGRSGHCALQLISPQASKEHFRVDLKGGDYVLVDMGSQSGTEVNGVKVEEISLKDLDRIVIGDTIIVFERHDN